MAADTAHVSCFVTSHLFDKEQGEGRGRREQQPQPEKHPRRESPRWGVLLLLLFDGQERV